MKFLCPSCKAKYQIADEKVIGRSVKMKCRQCGHVIEIQEAVVEASAGGVSQPPIALNSLPAPPLAPPPKPAKAGVETREGTPRAPLTKPAVGQKPRPAAAQPTRHAPMVGSTAGARPGIGVAAQARPLGTPLKGPTATTERVAAAPTGDRAVARPAAPGLETLRNLGGHKAIHSPAARPAPTPASSPTATAAAAPVSSKAATAVASADHSEQAALPVEQSHHASNKRAGEALVEAFASAVGVPSTTSEPIVGDEWYVGIDDNPIGPIPLADLRARATRGQVTIDSLVWRDGFEDWKPVRSFPELLAVVEEAISSINASRGPVSALRVAAGPSPAVAPVIAPKVEAAQTATAAGTGAAAAAAPASQVLHVVSPTLTPEELAAATGRSHRKTPPGVWIAGGGALALGLAIGFVFFHQAPVAPQIKYIQVAPSASSNPVSVATSAPSADNQDTPIVASAESISGKVRRTTASGDPKTTAESTAVKTSTGLAGLQDLRNVGPRTGPGETGANPGASGGQGLDSATLQKTVSRYTASVRRSCWQPALDSRSPDAPTSARVSVKIDISASGNVSSASSSGDPKGYRGLASCIESRVRNWTFPPSSGSTTVNVPFVFAAQ